MVRCIPSRAAALHGDMVCAVLLFPSVLIGVELDGQAVRNTLAGTRIRAGVAVAIAQWSAISAGVSDSALNLALEF